MTVMEFINAHREDMEPCECVILPDGSVEEPQPSHIKSWRKSPAKKITDTEQPYGEKYEPIFSWWSIPAVC